MNRFDYVRVSSIDDAIRALQRPGAKVLAGGTNLVDLMKYDVAKPSCVVDINRLPLGRIEALDDGGLRLGALVPNADAAYHDLVLQRAPLVASAILAGASPQLRNAATTGGNLLQRTRCFYFYDPDMPCNKRDPGSGCPAIGGVNRMHAILGASGACVAVHPSDMCVALAALDARINVIGPTGGRVIPMGEFHRLPGTQPEIDTTLAADEVIVSVELPPWNFGSHYTYIKVRDRLSYAFALVSVAATVRLEGDRIAEARLAMGGVAHKPWRDLETERSLIGKRATPEAFESAAEMVLASAVGLTHNSFKIDLARRVIVRALEQASTGTPQSQTDKRIG